MSKNQLLYLLEKPRTKYKFRGRGNIKSGFMRIRSIIIVFISSVIMFSCSGNLEKPDRAEIIPEKDLMAILTEIEIADALLPNPKIQKWVLSVDSISLYHYIAEKHGYTKASFDKTMYYYFVRKPKKLISIYDKVLGKLSEMESLLEKEVMLAREHSSNIWTGEKNYYFPDSSGTQCVSFQLSLAGSRIYNLKFTTTLFPDDQSVNPRARVFTCDADSVLTGTKSYYETPAFLKDGKPHTYTLRIFVASNETFVLKGTLFDIDNYLEEWQKHVRFENITLSIPAADI
jgi:hypothetical protein